MAERGRSHDRHTRRRVPRVHGSADAAEVVKRLVCDEHTEGQLIFGIDESGRVCGAVFNCPCDACQDEIVNRAEGLVDLAVAMRAEALVLATFVVTDQLAPTPAEVARFEGLRLECADHDVRLVDHLLFSGHRWRSVGELSVGHDA
jgi:hypothetical protein